MPSLMSWVAKLFKSGYEPGAARFAPVFTDSPMLPKGRSAAPAGAAQPAALKHPAPAMTYDGHYNDFPAFVDTCYFDWISGKSSHDTVSDEALEKRIIDYLNALADSELAGANLIPRVPDVMVQLLKRMHEDNVSGSELARIIAKDVSLLAAILTEVNSSFYNMDTRISELSQAILLLGHNRLRILLAKLSFRPVYSDQLGRYSMLTSAKIWDESQQRALAGYVLARHHKVDPFMAFLAGLMQDVGLVVALRVFDRSAGNSDLPAAARFRRALRNNALLLSTRIGQTWSMPEIVSRAIEAQSVDRNALAKIPLAKVLKKADFISKTATLIKAGCLCADMEQIREILTESELDCLINLLEGRISVANIL